MESVTVVGASLSGHSMVRALRQEGFTGSITVVGDEHHRPYDRPPLSKEFLLGLVDESALALEIAGDELSARWLLGHRAVSLDAQARAVTLADGTTITSDVVVLATGSRARRLDASDHRLLGVHTLRGLDDARALRGDLLPGRRLVIAGFGFVGAEAAAVAVGLDLRVTALEVQHQPFTGPLGDLVGAAVTDLHRRRGVDLRTGVAVAALHGTQRVEAVELTNGEVLEADVVLVAVGSEPNTDWLDGSGLDLTGGLHVDSTGWTGVHGIYGVGDVAAWLDPATGTARRVEHWTDSRDRTTITARAMIHGASASTPNLPAPYFWSDMYDVRIQFAGRRDGSDRFTVEAGDAQSENLLGVFWRSDEPVAVVGMNRSRELVRWRRRIASTPRPTRTDRLTATERPSSP
jgi:NADPH-dependent 2,4-dienoyl-CoA reductase/sulfur reductase-like enzyme